MAINVTYLSFPSNVETGRPKPIAIQIENDTANDITISGISLIDRAELFTGGAFIPCFPVAENIYSVGTPELNPIPAWGTAEQSSENINVPAGDPQTPLIYFPANLSGVAYVPAVEGINYASGSYGGQSVNIPADSDPLISTSVVIPAGETCYYATQFTSLVQGSLLQPLPDQVELYGDIEILVLVEGDTEALSTGLTDPLLYTGTSVGLSVVPVGLKGSSNVLVGSGADIINLVQYGRNPQYAPPVWEGGTSAGFNFPLRALLDIDDGRQIDVTRFCTYTSSDPVLTVVAGPSAYEATPIPPAVLPTGGNSQTIGGGGACTIDPFSADDFEPIYSILEATMPGQSVDPATTSVGVLKYLGLPVQFRILETSPIVARYTPSAITYTCTPVIIYEDGFVEEEQEIGGGYVLMEFDTATNQGDGITGGIFSWDDQDLGTFNVSNVAVETRTFIKITWIDTAFPLLMGLAPIYVPLIATPN